MLPPTTPRTSTSKSDPRENPVDFGLVGRSLGTKPIPQHVREPGRGLVDEPIARIVPSRPPLQARPVPTLAHLTHPRLGGLANGGVAGRVVGVADDVLPERVHAVEDVCEPSTLPLPVGEFHERDVDGSLGSKRVVISVSDGFFVRILGEKEKREGEDKRGVGLVKNGQGFRGHTSSM